MPRRPPVLAKLTLPRLYAVTRRERLFKVIKEHCENYPLVWVAGPPGAGKTSLIASYLAEHKQHALWYHVDSGDADLATFFHCLAQAAQAAAGRKQVRLPVLTPEFMADAPGFTRRFVRELWSKVPAPAVLVLDNYHELPAKAGLHSILPVALAEFPVGATLIVISRHETPPHFARELTHNRIGHIKWNELRLTFDETLALARSVRGIEQDTLITLHTKANGWVAGTVLMLERLKANAAWNGPVSSDTMTGVFHYFADQVFKQMNARERDVLMRTTLLPWVTGPMAEEVSEDVDAAAVLRELYQRGLFVDRHADAQVHYRYHDLFREFLRDRCHACYGEQQLQSRKCTAAIVAERAGQPDTAVSLYAETQSWDELSRFICAISETLLSQGRYQTVQRYIALLPHNERQQRPWLLYWSGVSRLVFDPVTARKDLEEAYQQFECGDGDIEGLFLSCSGIIESYICGVDDMAPAVHWGNRLYHLWRQHNGFPSPAIEVKVLAGLQGIVYASSHHPLLTELEGSVDQILCSLDAPQDYLGVATAFINLFLWRGDFRRVQQILDQVNSSMASTLIIRPVTLLNWKAMEANCAWFMRSQVQFTVKLQEALDLAETYGIVIFKSMIWGIQAIAALADGNDKEAERFLELTQGATRSGQRLALGQCSHYRAGIALMRGHPDSALDHAQRAVNMTACLSLPFLTGYCRVGLGKVLIGLGKLEEAREQLNAVLEYARIMRSSITEVHCFLTMAQSFFKEGQVERGNESLREGLRIGCVNDYLTLGYWWRPKVMAELLAHVLEAGIEVEYVRSVIRRRGLRAPSAALKHWPYPVKIATMGRFEIVIDDVLLTTTGKTQRKPLELLKYLCTAGTQGVHQDAIEETLWPDADGEATDQAFRTTLHRLRKLLRHDDAVKLSDRHVSLDPSLVLLDHLAFDRMAQDVDRTDTVAIERTLALYRGHFLQGEIAPWVLPVREQLRARFLDLTERLGTLLEERGQAGEAAQKYLRALEVEPVAEVMCRCVMMTYVRLGRRSEAISIYQRFNHALQSKFGISPTLETVSLYHTITVSRHPEA